MNEYNNTVTWTGQKEWEPWTGSNRCPNCGCDEIEYKTKFILTSYPPQSSLRCKKCGHHFGSGCKVDLIDNDELNKLYEHVKDVWGIPEIRDPLPGEVPYIGDWPLAPTPSPLNYGWICPKCGRVLAPHVNSCPHCSEPTTINITY